VIAYLTHDEVNAAEARRAALEAGLDLTVLPIKDGGQAAAADAMLLDLDHLPADIKLDLLRRAAGGRLSNCVAVHSYQLSPAEVRALRAAGVLVSRRLTACLLDAGSVAGTFRQSDGSAAPHPL